LNDNPKDNRLENLQYGTQKENVADAYRNGKRHNRVTGDGNPTRKLFTEDIIWCRVWREAGYNNADIGAAFDVDPSCVSRNLKVPPST
jgi:hypothetical protein